MKWFTWCTICKTIHFLYNSSQNGPPSEWPNVEPAGFARRRGNQPMCFRQAFPLAINLAEKSTNLRCPDHFSCPTDFDFAATFSHFATQLHIQWSDIATKWWRVVSHHTLRSTKGKTCILETILEIDFDWSVPNTTCTHPEWPSTLVSTLGSPVPGVIQTWACMESIPDRCPTVWLVINGMLGLGWGAPCIEIAMEIFGVSTIFHEIVLND